MRMPAWKLTALLAPLALAGCFSAKGPVAPDPVTFTSFANVRPDSTVRMSGVGHEVAVTRDGSGVSSAEEAGKASSMTAELSTDAQGRVIGLKVNGEKNVAHWKVNAAAPQDGVFTGVAGGGATAFYLDPSNPEAFDYQTFGIWTTGDGAAQGTHGAFSAGGTTSGVSVPAGGTATFRGYSIGSYIGEDGSEHVATASASLNANFADRSVAFQTSDTYSAPAGGGAARKADGLNLSGGMSYDQGSGAMTGAVHSANGMSGVLSGRFYGPGAEEVGGVFSLEAPGDGVQRYTGAFGARQE